MGATKVIALWRAVGLGNEIGYGRLESRMTSLDPTNSVIHDFDAESASSDAG
jgi:hypothetical protein